MYGGIGKLVMRRRPKMMRIIDGGRLAGRHFEEIPVVVVACMRGPRLRFPPLAPPRYYGSIYPAVQNLLLAARAANSARP